MPFSLTYIGSKSSKKSLSKLPSRKAQSRWSQKVVKERSTKNSLKNIQLSLGGTLSYFMANGNWCTEPERNSESKELLKLRHRQEKLCKEKDILNARNNILFELAKTKVDELQKLEREKRQLRHILKLSALQTRKNS